MKQKLSKKDQIRAKHAAERESAAANAARTARKRRLGRIIVGIIAIIAVLIGAERAWYNYFPLNAPDTLIISDEFGTSDSNNIIRAAEVWCVTFACPNHVDVKPFAAKMKDSTYQGYEQRLIEEAGPGYMFIDPDASYDIYGTTLHAMSHAMEPTEIITFTQPVPFIDGHIIGSQGPNVHVTLAGGEEQWYRKLGEGIAERNAYCVDPSYDSIHPGYKAVMELALQDFPCEDNRVQSYSDKNNLLAIAGLAMGKNPETQPGTFGDLNAVMEQYSDAFERGAEIKP